MKTPVILQAWLDGLIMGVGLEWVVTHSPMLVWSQMMPTYIKEADGVGFDVLCAKWAAIQEGCQVVCGLFPTPSEKQ